MEIRSTKSEIRNKFKIQNPNDQNYGPGGNELLPLYVNVGFCVFPEPGQYGFEIYSGHGGGEALKGEYPFAVISQKE